MTEHSNGVDRSIEALTMVPVSKHLNGWRACAYIMIIEHRHCECGVSHIAPALEPRVRMVNLRGATRTVSMGFLSDIYRRLAKAMQREFNYPILEREVQHIDMDVLACQYCFSEYPAEQEELFPVQLPVKVGEIVSMMEKISSFEGEQMEEQLKAFVDEKLNRGKKKKPVEVIVPLDLSQFI